MILKPMIRNNICINAHPAGCAAETMRQIGFVQERGRSRKAAEKPVNVLVIGCSTGFGLASRIVAAFGYGANTFGVSYEKAPTDTRTGTPGWYNNKAFDEAVISAGIASRTFDGDAFSRTMKSEVEAAGGQGVSFDLVIYSLASPVRVDPDTGEMYRSVIKPLHRPYRGTSVDIMNGTLSQAEIEPATPREAEETVKVMGGEDWALWIDTLAAAGLLSQGATTVAYSYIGPKLSWPIYHDGTIGQAKAHLETTAGMLRSRHAATGLRPFISVNKALVTRASAVIPVIPLYVSTLFRVMKERGIHEDCIGQIHRLFGERLYSGTPVPLDGSGRIRIDDLEMGKAVQTEVQDRMNRVNQSNLDELADLEGFRSDFLRVHGFGVEGIDYTAECPALGVSIAGFASGCTTDGATRKVASGNL